MIDILNNRFTRPVRDTKVSPVQLHPLKNRRSATCCKSENRCTETEKDSGLYESSTASQRPSAYSSEVFSEVSTTSTSPSTTTSSAYYSSAGLSCSGKEREGPTSTTGFQEKSSKLINKIAKHGQVMASEGNICQLSQSSKLSRMSRSISLKSEKSLSDDKIYLHDSTNEKVYEKCRMLGKGGFARVYEVNELDAHYDKDFKPRTKMAAKVIDKSRIARTSQRAKVDTEIKLLKEARGHPNIVNYINSFETKNSVCILLELCSKKSLAQYMRRKSSCLRESEICAIMLQIISGLAHLHGKGIIHRDLKLGNILLTEDMQVKIGDLGLASLIDSKSRNTICGTPNYIAPEVLQRRGYGPKSDIWALGCLLYSLAVGKSPFESTCLKETCRNILKNNYRIPTCVSPEAADLIRSMLQGNPNARPTLEEIASHTLFKKHCKSCESLRKSAFSTGFDASVKTTDSVFLSVSTRSSEEASESMKGAKSSSNSNPTKQQAQLLLHYLQRKFKTASSQTNGQKESVADREKNLPASVNSSLRNANAISSSSTWVDKWVDYSNRYGFGYQLSNGGIGVLFNDGKHVFLNPVTKTIEYTASQNSKTLSFEQDAVPLCLEKYTAALGSFTSFMDISLAENFDKTSRSEEKVSARLLSWCRTNDYIAMYLSDGTLQVNFIEDHTKVGISSLHNKNAMVITVIDQKRRKKVYDATDIAASADAHLLEKLSSVHKQFHHFFDVNCGSQPICELCSPCN